MPGGVFSTPEHLPPPVHKVKKSNEELEKSAQRLSTPRKQREPSDDHMLSPRVVKSAAELEKTSDRLYTAAVEKRQRKLDTIRENEAKPLSPRKEASPEEIAEGVQHLYQQALDQKRHSDDALRKKYQFQPPKSPPHVSRGTSGEGAMRCMSCTCLDVECALAISIDSILCVRSSSIFCILLPVIAAAIIIPSRPSVRALIFCSNLAIFIEFCIVIPSSRSHVSLVVLACGEHDRLSGLE